MTTMGWGSKNAESMYHIAVKLANFNPIELMLEIARIQKDPSKTTNEATVTHAMQNIFDKYGKRDFEEGN